MNEIQRRLVWLVEEVPGVEPDWAFYISCEGDGLLWHGRTADEGRAWANAQGIKIDNYEPFEP